MENVERADGFWWVRLNPGPRSAALGDGALALWRVLWFFGDSLMTHAPRDGGEFVAMKERVAEWGPYLGKEPETIESLDRKIAEMMATRLPLFADFDPSTDYEGEQTRAIDGAMMRDAQLHQRCPSRHPTAGLHCEKPAGHDDGHAGWVLGGPVIPWPCDVDGAGITLTAPNVDGGPPFTVTIPGIRVVASEACPPEAVYMSTDREIVVIKLGKVHRT
jgi:hypothetical protein